MAMLALKPPMGWNAWNTFGHADIKESVVLETADAMVKNGYLELGYDTLTVDDCWMAPTRDENGHLQANKERFPHGMKFIGDYLHEKGLKFGIYSDCGTMTCAGLAASYGFEREDARTFASWGVDLLKYDGCYRAPGADTVVLYRRMGQALRECGRDILFSGCCAMKDVWKWMRTSGAQMWRVADDILDSWKDIKRVGLGAFGLEAYTGPCGWNDTDMLVVGVDGKGWVGGIGGGCTDVEYRTHFALWCMLGAPLFMGHDIRNERPEIREILQNKELIAIDQDDLGIAGYRIADNVFAKPLYGGDIACCVVNEDDVWHYYSLSWEQCGLEVTDSVKIRDCINHKDLGIVKRNMTVKVEPHDCLVYRITRI